jgi:hypothetical protein
MNRTHQRNRHATAQIRPPDRSTCFLLSMVHPGPPSFTHPVSDQPNRRSHPSQSEAAEAKLAASGSCPLRPGVSSPVAAKTTFSFRCRDGQDNQARSKATIRASERQVAQAMAHDYSPLLDHVSDTQLQLPWHPLRGHKHPAILLEN